MTAETGQTPGHARRDDPAAALAEATRLADNGDATGAAAGYEYVLAAGDDELSAEAAFRLGRLLTSQGDAAAAIAAYRRALPLADTAYRSLCALEAGVLLHNEQEDLAAAAEMYRRVMDSRHSDNAALAACNLGIVLEAQGDLSGAVLAYRAAHGCGDQQQLPRAALHLGQALEQRGDTRGAVAAYERVLQFDRTELSAQAAFWLGNLLDEQGDKDAAATAYRRGLPFSDSPYQPMCAINLAEALAAGGDNAGATEMYREALRSPHQENAALAAANLGELLERQGDVAAALAAYRKAIGFRHVEQSPRAALALGGLLEEHADAAGAAQAYRQVLEFDDEERSGQARHRLEQLRAAQVHQARSAAHAAVMRWAAAHLEEGDERGRANFADRIARLQSKHGNLELKVSAEQSKTRAGNYGVSWLDEFHAFDLSAHQARQLSIDPGSISIRGVGGDPRADIRKSPPDVRLERLRINDGGIVTDDAPLMVAVSYQPATRLARDVRLRVGYLANEVNVSVSSPFGDGPSDGVLHQQLEPPASIGWSEGPVPIFVDLVVIHSESPHLQFTVVSNTLTELIDVVPKAWAAVRAEITRWVGAHFVHANDETQAELAKVLAEVPAEYREVRVELSADLSTTGRSMYGASWLDQFHAFELTEHQAGQLGIAPGTISIQGIGASPRAASRQLPPDVRIDALQVNEGAPISAIDPITVTVRCDPATRQLQDLRLRVGCVTGGLNVALSPVITEMPADGMLRWERSPFAEDDWAEGPVPIFVDLVLAPGDGDDPQFTVVSNTLSALVDVSAPSTASPEPDTDMATRDPQLAVREAVMAWARDHLEATTDDTVADLAEDVASEQSAHIAVVARLSAELSKNGRPVYGVSWFDEFYSYELSAAQARQLGFLPDTFRVDGVGSPARVSRQRSPDAHIEQLEVGNGAPVCIDARLTVSVRCTAPTRLPLDSCLVGLRVGYVMDNLDAGMWVGPRILQIPPDGILRVNLESLASGGAFEGPMPIFADLVAIDDDPDEPQFNVISNTLSTLVDVTRTSRTVRPREVRQAAVQWCRSVLDGAPERLQAVTKLIDPILGAGNHFVMLVPGRLTKDQTAYFAASCAGGFFVFALTADQAAAVGADAGDVRVTATAAFERGGRPHTARLHGLQIAGGDVLTSNGVTGVVGVTCTGAPPEVATLRMTYMLAGSEHVCAQAVSVPGDGPLALAITNPALELDSGPVVVAIDLCVPEDSPPSGALRSVSNTVARLLDMAQAPVPHSAVPASVDVGGESADLSLARGDALIEVVGGHQFRVPKGKSRTVGSGSNADVRVDHPSVAPLHLRIDNRVTSPGISRTHPYSGMVLVTDIGGASSGPNLFGAESEQSRTGVIKDLESGFVMPLELQEMTAIRDGTVVLFGDLQLRLVAGG